MVYNTELIVNDIREITRDYLKFFKETRNKKLSLVRDYVSSILEELYDKKMVKKYLYNEILEQLISTEFPYLNIDYKLKITRNRKKYLKSRVKCLLEKPQSEQRSAEWHEQRKNSIGASELASVFNKNPFCSYNKYLLKKSGYIDKNERNDVSIYCLHGIKYEEIVQKIYCLRNSVEIFEFGSIEDETHSWLRASPDGITPGGTMLEIKVPYSREIFGLPPIYYWFQMQHQMKVCKLNQCDFLECNISEYSSWNEFLEDTYNDDICLSNEGLEKGVIIEYMNINETNPWNKTGHLYPDNIKQSLDDIYIWNKKTKIELHHDPEKKYLRIIPWKLNKYSCIRIFRNRNWWKNNFNIIQNFWKKVEEYKVKGYTELIPIKRIRKKKIIEEIEYTFLSDSDND